MKGILDNGFEFEVRDTAANDWELLKVLRKIDRGEEDYIIDAAELLLGEEQLERLEKYVEKDGVTPLTEMISCIKEVFEKARPAKN